MVANIASPEVQCAEPRSALDPLVSIIIVCYNQAHFLADAIDSALNQTYENLEILLVDDGSTDETRDIIRRYPRVRHFRQENQGLSAARNAGLRETVGSFVVFLDADDRLLPNAIASGLKCFSQHPKSGFVFGGFRVIYGNGFSALPENRNRVDKDHYWHLLQRNIVGMHATVMYPRGVLEEFGGFNPQLRACEDYELYLRIARSYPVAQHGAPIAEYRQHETNLSLDSVLMLGSALQVLRKEKSHIPDRKHDLALRTGMKAWKRYYGDLAINAWRRKSSLRGLLAIGRHYPLGLIQRGWKFVRGRAGLPASPANIDFGSLRRLSPVSRQFGFDRGQPVDRYYIEAFLADHIADICGQVLEIGDSRYSKKFGTERVTGQDVLQLSAGPLGSTIVADLTDAPRIPTERFDSIILTQTLHLIYDLRAALATLSRILKPGGVLLATLPGISRVCREPEYPEADSWRFTASSSHRLFREFFPKEDHVLVKSYGNVFTASAFLYGLATHELSANELECHDPDYPVIIGVRAQKATNAE